MDKKSTITIKTKNGPNLVYGPPLWDVLNIKKAVGSIQSRFAGGGDTTAIATAEYIPGGAVPDTISASATSLPNKGGISAAEVSDPFLLPPGQYSESPSFSNITLSAESGEMVAMQYSVMDSSSTIPVWSLDIIAVGPILGPDSLQITFDYDSSRLTNISPPPSEIVADIQAAFSTNGQNSVTAATLSPFTGTYTVSGTSVEAEDGLIAATNSPAPGVPTLPEWAAIIMGIALVSLSIFRMRRMPSVSAI